MRRAGYGTGKPTQEMAPQGPEPKGENAVAQDPKPEREKVVTQGIGYAMGTSQSGKRAPKSDGTINAKGHGSTIS